MDRSTRRQLPVGGACRLLGGDGSMDRTRRRKTWTGAGDPARKYRSMVIGPTSYLWRTGVMRVVYWFFDAYESFVSLIRTGMEG